MKEKERRRHVGGRMKGIFREVYDLMNETFDITKFLENVFIEEYNLDFYKKNFLIFGGE